MSDTNISLFDLRIERLHRLPEPYGTVVASLKTGDDGTRVSLHLGKDSDTISGLLDGLRQAYADLLAWEDDGSCVRCDQQSTKPVCGQCR